MRNLELVISSGPDGSYLVAARSDAGDTQETPTRFPFDDRALERHLRAVEFALMRAAANLRQLVPAEEQPVQDFGRQLFDFLFPALVRDHLSAVRNQAAREGTALQVRLRIRPPELAALPWEFLYDPGRDEYLSLSTPLVRYLEVLEPLRPLAVTAPLRVLGMVARPGDLGTLDVDHEKRRLLQALAGLEHAGRVQLSWVAGETWRDLQDALDQGGWHIFHFIGHGGFDTERGEGILALADEEGGAFRISASDLGLLLGDCRSLRLVVLNSCESARASTGDVFSSTAAVLMRRGIPAVVAMQYDISDEAAITFARGLYDAVANPLPVDQAVTRARMAIKLTRRNTLEWATPVLYLRSPSADLFDITAPPPIVEPRRQVGSELARMQHDDRVWAAAFSPDGKQLATASLDKTVRLWETATGRELARMQHDGPVWAAAFSPDSTWLASWGTTVWLWETATGRELARMQHNDVVLAVAFSPDGTRLATASRDRTDRLWETATGRELARTTHKDVIDAAAFSPDGTRLATASWDRTARLWETATGRELARMTHDGPVWAVTFSPHGTRLATAGRDRTARLWETATGRELARMTHDGPVSTVTFSPHGTRLATASDKTARLWETATGRELARMKHRSRVSTVAFSPDGTRLATASDKTARLWETATGRELAQMTHDDRVSAVTFSPDGPRLGTTASWDKMARLWETATGQKLARMKHGSPVSAVTFSPDGPRLGTTASWDKMARLWETATGQKLARMKHGSPVSAVTFSPDGTQLATAGDKTVRLWVA